LIRSSFISTGLLVALTIVGVARAAESMAVLDAWSTAKLMGVGVNIGNTLENTTSWETGWGNPRITRKYVESLAAMGFKTVRLPVAWDTYARDGRIPDDKLARVGEVVQWITDAGMFCVVNIHWDGGWIDSSNKEKFRKTHATFSAEAARKFQAYWTQIANYFAGHDERLLFEALNEETNFEGEGSTKKAYATLTRVNQLFIDTVRKTGGNNANRLLIVTGYSTDFTKTTSDDYVLPKDSVPHRLLISVHYYTPWQFAGMTQDESWGKVQATWGSDSDVAELNRLFDLMQEFCKRNDLPAFIGEFGVTDKKEAVSRVRWMTAVAQAALARKMVPVLWDTGGDIARNSPHAASPALQLTLRAIGNSTPKAEGPGAQEVVKELGAVLGWRLSPEAVEEHCRSVDPDGAAARKTLLQDWLTKNDALIKSVDTRVAEVVALLEPGAKPDELVASLEAQVNKLILEGTFTGKAEDESRAICKAEADPAAARWKNSGVRHVQQSLAALYDWTVMQSRK
jgi:endoglucanase